MAQTKMDKIMIRLATAERTIVALSTHIAKLYEAHPELQPEELKSALAEQKKLDEEREYNEEPMKKD